MPEQQYEYKTVKSTAKDFGTGAMETDLNELAVDGWSVLEPIQSSGNTVGWVLQRPVE